MSAQQSAQRAASSNTLERLARVGLIAYGVVHLLIAWLALQLAWGGGGGEASQSGAMQTLAQEPYGTPLLWVLGLGLIALALWQAGSVLAFVGRLGGGGDAKKKAVTGIVKCVAKVVVYGFLAFTALRFATGSGSSSSDQQQQTTSGVFALPGGRYLVGIAALVVIGVGVYQVVKGVQASFMKEIDTSEASGSQVRVVRRLGQVGYVAKGIAFVVVGGLLAYAAITFDASESTGLDGAMRTILDAPFGTWLLTLVALGIAAFGVFCFARARWPQRT
ncbi:DUF1206 domain-containing protein [Modestobacter sp. Leaf380]|uniref:DUF1206 domain-containing protein n=1 Tax=Modestobacter sp. Leaf380 TaxID=1736356 RepID=UPI0006F3FC7A|nr:DUF1206 domain-containing protein [Modestobacter sp. Leaf380]KQS69175.1 hypothetical protein ASG41_22120 [Modestobacter sp. Leaf380]